MPNRGSNTRAQDLPPVVANACRAITALMVKLERTEEKASQYEEKASQYQRSIGQRINAIKNARPDDWETIVRDRCKLGRSRAYELMAIAAGTKTPEQVRADNAGRKREERKRQSVTSRTENNAGDPEASAEVMKNDTEPEAVRSGTDDDAARHWGPWAASRHDADLAEQLRLAEIKIAGLESEIAEFKLEVERLELINRLQREDFNAEKFELEAKISEQQAEISKLRAKVRKLEGKPAVLIEGTAMRIN